MINLISTKKLVVLFVSGLLLLSLTLSASDSRKGGKGQGEQRGPNTMTTEQVEAMVVEMTTKLSLTEDQVSKITELFKVHIAEVKAAQDERSGDRDSHRTKMDELRKDFEAKVNAVLTVEQQKLFKDMDRNRQEGRRDTKGQHSKK